MGNSVSITNLSKTGTQAPRSFEAIWKMARVLHRKGHTAQAVRYYQQLLAIEPERFDTLVVLTDLLKEQNDWDAAIDVYGNWLQDYPESHGYSSKAHKSYIDALHHHRGIEAAFDAYELIRQDKKELTIEPDEVICCIVARNEMLRLPYFLDYYRGQGIKTFFAVSNDSTDQTLSYLLEQPDVYVWHSPYSFNQANCGAAWTELILRCFGVGHWVLWVDADELLYYPACEERTIVDLCAELDSKGKTAYRVIHLDMYADKPIQETDYTAGTDFLSTCPYFDRQFYHVKRPLSGPFRNLTNYIGGVRTRVFGGDDSRYLLNKTPLFKYQANDILTSGTHHVNRSLDEISAQQGALLHFKYFSTFHQFIADEIDRNEMPKNAAAHKQYASQIAVDNAITLYDPLHSVRLESSEQLMRMGIIQDGNFGIGRKEEEKHENRPLQIDFPQITPYPNHESTFAERPFWSIMIPVDDSSQQLERCLNSVMVQLTADEIAQVEILYDKTSKQISGKIERTVESIGDARLHVHHSDRYLGYPAILTLCIERAAGQWIHLLSANDWLKPYFYTTMQKAIENQPSISVACCRFEFGHSSNNAARNRDAPCKLSSLEQPASGFLSDWLPKIITRNRTALSSMIVKREVYEQIGGYYHPLLSAAEWEMCQRLACSYPLWYETNVLASVSDRPLAISYDEKPSMRPSFRDAFNAIDVVSSYLPKDLSMLYIQSGRDKIARQALALAKEHLRRGDFHTALLDLGEGLRGDVPLSPEINAELRTLLNQIIS